jgi:DNA-binding LacI/PurR family transcriptional regulator
MTSHPRKPPVIADVARLAGVSVPTVSRYMTGSARVSPGKSRLIAEAIAALNFRPSSVARALVSGPPKMVAVLTGNTSQYGYAETIRGIEEGARAAGYLVTISVVESAELPAVEQTIQLVLEQTVAGLIVLTFNPAGVAALHALPPGIPRVAIAGAREKGTPQAVLAEADAAEELTNYLLALGHETVHHVRVPPSRREDGRTLGWRRALRAAGKPVPPIIESDWDPYTGESIGRQIAGRGDITAVFCGNDEIAMGVIRGLKELGKHVPDDISVTGFDDHPLAGLWTPPLTTVRQDFAALGRRAWQMLQDILDDHPGKRFASDRPPLVIRESAAAPRSLRT